jgi:hypothetical protein
MASGTTLDVLYAESMFPPASGYATLDTRNSIPVALFPDAVTAALLGKSVIPSSDIYAGGGLTFDIYAMATVTSGDVKVGVSLERNNANNHDQDTDAFATEQIATVTVNATSGKYFKATVTVSSGANMDSAVAGDPIRIRLRRIGGDAADTATGVWQFDRMVMKET